MKDIFIGVAMGVMLTMGLLLWGLCKGELVMPRSHPSLTLISHIDDLPSMSLEEQLLLRELVRPHGFRQQPLPPMPHPFPKVPLYQWQLPCP